MKRETLIVWTLAKVTCVVLFAGWCALHLRRFDPYFGIRLPGWSRGIGWIFLVVGGALVLTCGGILSTRGITEPGSRLFPKEFVAFGPFRYTRNPMSLGAVTLIAGLGLFERSISILLLGLALFLVFHLVVVYMEEPGLERRFGESYLAYKGSVNRWLPKMGARKS